MGESQPRKLSDVAEIVMGQSPTGETCNNDGIGLPLLNGPTEFGPNHPTPTQFTTDAKKLSQADDLLFCVRGSTTGRMNWSDQVYAIGRGIAAIRHKSNPALQSLIRAAVENDLANLLQSATGSTFPNVSANQLARVSFPRLTEGEEISIASVLSALDDKIELNRRMNETLEGMARAIFKDWFVDFGPTRTKMEGGEPYLVPEIWNIFPDRLDEEGKPEGWEEKPLSEFFSIIGGGTPKTKVSEFWNGDIPWFSVVDAPQDGEVFVLATEKTITQRGVAESSARLVRKGITIISARGTVGKLAMTGQEMTFNQSCYGLEGSNEVGDCFTFLAAQHMVSQLQSMAHGSVFSTITRATFDAISLAKASDPIFKEFEKLTSDLFSKTHANGEESRTLAQTRDLLLPKLMSGEIRVRDAEKQIGEAG